MPLWNFFAFDARSAAKHLLTPLQQALRNRDLPGWQSEFKKLQKVHRHARISPFGGPYGNHEPITAIEYFHAKPDLSENVVPDESSPSLRWLLQEFVEAIAPHYLQGTFPRPRSWILNEISWPRLVASPAEHAQITMFKQLVLGWPK